MNNNHNAMRALPGYRSAVLLGMLAGLLCFSLGAQATAPRIAPQLFGEERKADIAAYQGAAADPAARAEGELAVALVDAAFRAAGKTLVVDVQPSRQLARYALTNGDVVALIGVPRDITPQEATQYRVITFMLRGTGANEEPVALIVSKKHARGNELQQAFNVGLQKIISSGKYEEILESQRGKDQIPAGYFSRLKRHNPALK